MRAIFVLSLIALVSVASSVEYTQLNAQVKKVSHSRWGRLLVELAELHTLAKGPLNDLISHLEKLV